MFEMSARLCEKERCVDNMNVLTVAFVSAMNVSGLSASSAINNDVLNEMRLLSMYSIDTSHEEARE
jgi:hypothetical protein